MPNPIRPPSNSIQLGSGKKRNAINTLSNPSLQLNRNTLEGGKNKNMPYRTTIGKRSDGLDGSDRITIVNSSILAAPNPSVKGGNYVALNDTRTQRIGENHACAKLSDKQVDAIRDAYERFPVGDPRHRGYNTLAKQFRVAKRTIRDIVNYSKRSQSPIEWKKV